MVRSSDAKTFLLLYLLGGGGGGGVVVVVFAGDFIQSKFVFNT